MNDTFEEMSAIAFTLKAASEYGLESEVIWTAMNELKSNPQISIREAVNLGYLEWVK